MQATKILGDEHAWIRHLLDCLEKLAKDARRYGRLNLEVTSELLFLLESFADGEHQDKEEQVLLPLLLRKVGLEEEGAMRELLEEHALERPQLEETRASLEAVVRGEPGSVLRFAREAAVCAALHREHLAHEDGVLLPLVEGRLTHEEDAEVVDAFRHLIGGHAAVEMEERVRALCHRVGVPA